MKCITRTEYVGERTGDVDWSFDWTDEGKLSFERAAEVAVRMSTLFEGLARGETWEATDDGGWPRVGWGKVLDVAMYDGWPYWKPVPSVLILSWTGNASWHSCWSIHDTLRVLGEKSRLTPADQSSGGV